MTWSSPPTLGCLWRRSYPPSALFCISFLADRCKKCHFLCYAQMEVIMRTVKAVIGSSALVILLLAAAVPSWAQKKADPDQEADLSRLVVVGDSLSAGFQNGSLLDSQQPHGYASLVAKQARVDLPLPLIAAPGIPN